ncbi:DUF4159 domain-containing protein [Fidelibacter multiformis]|uniref:DUF4159 domain-containing protein n=1 Tax=Fidelibacter multiformis TaxID=3377529 RepID=UPI0037DD003D
MKRCVRFSAILILCLITLEGTAGEPLLIGRLKYGGGGDWYANPGSLENLASFINKQTDLVVQETPVTVDIDSPDLFKVHFLHMTGHGNIFLTDEQVRRLRFYLENGGFLHADDNYGLDESFRREIKKVFPDKELVELPFSHPIYHQVFAFPKGLPKVHEHDGKPPQGFGMFHEGRLVVFYTYECDLGNGWEDAEVYGDPEEIRTAALQMGTNIYYYHINPAHP